jgi:ankyrin repeat protein
MPQNLASIAPELLLDIAEHLPLAALQAFLRCNRHLYQLLLGSLYKRAVATALCGCCQRTSRSLPWLGNARGVALSLAAGLDINAIVSCRNSRTRLYQAVRNWIYSRILQRPGKEAEEEEVIKLLLMHGADVNAKNYDGMTPLHSLSATLVPGGPNPVLEMLLRSGADVTAVSRGGQTPLHLAKYDVAAILLGMPGVDPNTVDKEGRSALHWALRSAGDGRQDRLVELLLRHGADPNIRDSKGLTPLLQALRNGSMLKVLALLLDHGADPNIGDQDGKLPLHYAINAQSPEMVALFLKYGADPKVPNDPNGLWNGRWSPLWNGRWSPLQNALLVLKDCRHWGRDERWVIEIVRLLVAGGALVEKLGGMDRELVKTICEGWQLVEDK